MQNLRRGHYEIAIDIASTQRVAAAFTELALLGLKTPTCAVTCCFLGSLCGSFVLVDQPAEDRLSAYPPVLGKVNDRGWRAWR
jgi:hypothetical protein